MFNLFAFALILAVDIVLKEELLSLALIIWAMAWFLSPLIRNHLSRD